MKIIIEQENNKYVYETDKLDILLSEMLEVFEGLLYQMGYRFKGELDFIEEEINDERTL